MLMARAAGICEDVSKGWSHGDAEVLGMIQQHLMSGHESTATGNEELGCTEALMKAKV